jgi:hypothetical protein
MRRLRLLLLSLMLLPTMALARQSAQGDCVLGGKVVVTNGLNSTTKVMASYPSCTVTVSIHGGGLATIYSDNAGTILANPFTASVAGHWQWYADNGHYDVLTSGGTPQAMPSSFTYSDIILDDTAQNSTSVCGLSFASNINFTAVACSDFTLTLTGNVTSSSVTSAVTGQQLAISICQDGTGGRTFSWPANFTRPPPISATAGTCTNTTFFFDGINWRLMSASGDTLTPTSNGITGTWSGSPTWTGNHTFSGAFTSIANANVGSLNSVRWVGSCVGCYVHVADAIAALGNPPGTPNLGTVMIQDGYTDFITTRLDIGFNVSPAIGVKVIMMPGSAINVAINTPTLPGIVIWDGSTLECLGSSFSGDVNGHLSTCWVLSTNGSTNISALVSSQTVITGGFQNTMGLNGVTLLAAAGTITNILDIGAIGAPSSIQYNTVMNTGATVQYAMRLHHGAGGGLVLLDNELRLGQIPNMKGLLIQGGETTGWLGSTSEITWIGGEISCMGDSMPAIVINGDIQGIGAHGVRSIWIKGVHSQFGGGCGGLTPPTDYVTINNAHGIHFEEGQYTFGGANAFKITESGGGKTTHITWDEVGASCNTSNCAGQTFATDTTTGGSTHQFQPNTLSLPSDGFINIIQHDEAGEPDAAYGDARRRIYNTSATAFSYPHAPLEVVGPIGAPGTTAGLILARFNAAGTASLWIGDNAYNGPWIQGIQDDGSNATKTISLNPLGGLVSVGSGGLNVNGGQTVTNTTGTGTNLVTSTSPTITTAALVTPTITSGGSWAGSPTLTTPTLTGLSNGTGDQLFNVTNTCTTAASAGATCTTAAETLPVAYGDTSYRVVCVGLAPTNIPVIQTVTKSNTTFTITIASLTAAAATYTSYDCRAGHN